jgi:hypothetical protein
MEELTPGQAEVLLRNERGIDAAMAELEDLEDELAESIRRGGGGTACGWVGVSGFRGAPGASGHGRRAGGCGMLSVSGQDVGC